jgi:hypothetical protein
MLETFVAVCESCRSKLTVPETAQGRVLPCPRCGVTFQIPKIADTVAENSQLTVYDVGGAQPAVDAVPPLAPLPESPRAARPVIVEPAKPLPAVKRAVKVRDADVFGPIPRPLPAAEAASSVDPDPDEDDDVPRRFRKRRRGEDTTRWGTDVDPDPFTTSNPELLRNDGWIDAHLVWLASWLLFWGLVVIIVGAVVRKLLLGLYEM